MQKTKPQPLSEEMIESLQGLGGTLMKVVERLVREGKARIENGKIVILKQ